MSGWDDSDGSCMSERCDKPWDPVKGDKFLIRCSRILKGAVCRGTTVTLVSHRNLQTSLNRNVIVLNSFFCL
jgi:hypothetical protein